MGLYIATVPPIGTNKQDELRQFFFFYIGTAAASRAGGRIHTSIAISWYVCTHLLRLVARTKAPPSKITDPCSDRVRGGGGGEVHTVKGRLAGYMVKQTAAICGVRIDGLSLVGGLLHVGKLRFLLSKCKHRDDGHIPNPVEVFIFRI